MSDDKKIIKGDFSQNETQKNNIITEGLDDPALKFTTGQWCDAFEMWQEVLWDRMMDPRKYMNLPDEAMTQMDAVSKQVTPEMRLGFEKQWKTLKKDLNEFGLHGAEFFTTVCSDKPPGYEIHRQDDNHYMFIAWDTWQACGQRFFDWYGQQSNAINPVSAVKKLLKDKLGIENEQQFLNSDLGRDGLIANPF